MTLWRGRGGKTSFNSASGKTSFKGSRVSTPFRVDRSLSEVPPEPPSNWILAQGAWDDTGVWIDNEVWYDTNPG